MYTGGRNTTITRNTGPMDIIPIMTGIVFPVHGYSREDSFPYPSVEIEIDFKRKLIDTSEVRDKYIPWPVLPDKHDRQNRRQLNTWNSGVIGAY
jgi:hypothetical protein